MSARAERSRHYGEKGCTDEDGKRMLSCAGRRHHDSRKLAPHFPTSNPGAAAGCKSRLVILYFPIGWKTYLSTLGAQLLLYEIRYWLVEDLRYLR